MKNLIRSHLLGLFVLGQMWAREECSSFWHPVFFIIHGLRIAHRLLHCAVPYACGSDGQLYITIPYC